jgi:Tol biopolymer transport system component
MSTSHPTRPAVDLTPDRDRRPQLALALALLSIPGVTFTWGLPGGGFLTGIPLALAAIVVGLRARRAARGRMMARVAVAIGALALAFVATWMIAGLEDDESSAAATPPAVKAAELVYWKERQGHQRLFTARADGTGEHQITHVEGDAGAPDWSPDGQRIVFGLDQPHGPPGCSVMIINADGSGLTDLTGRREGCDNDPAFTPDGKRLVFLHYDDSTDVEAIWSMDTSGGDRRLITGSRGSGRVDPNVSPNGRWVTFVRSRGDSGRQALVAVHPDGTKLHRLTPYSWRVAPKHDWSPDGKRIVLTTNHDLKRPHEGANLVTIRPDGSGVKRLTRFTPSKSAFAGSFSPDGAQIVFRLERNGKGALAVIDRLGGNLRTLTRPSADLPRFIDWGKR